MNGGALSSLKILEYGEFISAPYCGKLFADLGAQVIKVEKPGLGDKSRNWGPFPQDLPHPEKSGLFLFLNSNKTGITLNLETAAGVKIFQELARKVDVLIESNAPREMKRQGTDYESLRELNPGLVVTSITPFGQTGPFRDYRGCDLTNFHASGGAYMNPAEGIDNVEQKPPLKSPIHFADLTTGLTAAVSTMSAIIARKASGLGQQVDVSQQEALASTVRTEHANFVYEGSLPGRTIGRKTSGAMLYPCKDGHVVISGIGDGFWQGMVKIMGNPKWTGEEWCKDNVARSQNIERVNGMISLWTREHSAEEINREASAARVPCAPVRTVEYLARDEQLAARDFFVEIDHPVSGRLRYPGAPYKLSSTPWNLRCPAPLLGEHNEQIYCQMLGYTRKQLVKMRQAGVI